MKTTRLLVAALVLLLSFGTLTALAQSADELTDLTRYFPADTPMFFSVRTDDAFLDEIDALADLVRRGLPEANVPPFSVREALDAAIQEEFDGTFESVVGSWMGDTAAFGALSLESMMGMGPSEDVLIAISISDREGAEAFLDGLVEEADAPVERGESGDWTTYLPDTEFAAPRIAVNDEVMLIGTSEEVLNLSGDFQSLDGSEMFAASVGMLPAESYNAILALNIGDTLREMMAQMNEFMDDEERLLFEQLMPIYENYPAQAFGFTVLNGRALTFDLAQTAFDYSALEGTMLEGLAVVDMSALDLAFTQNVPADVPFFIQTSNVGASVQNGIEVFATLAEMGMAQYADRGSMDDVPEFMQDVDANDLRAFIDLSFAGMTGLNLSQDVLPNLNGNAAFFARVLPSTSLPLTLDLGAVFEVTDADATQAIIDGITDALEQYEADFSSEGGVVTIPGVFRAVLQEEFSDADLEDPQLDFLMGLSESVFALGTRPAVEYSLAPEGDSIADTAAFEAAQAFFVPDTEVLTYLNTAPLNDLVQQFGRGSDDASAVGALLTFIESASITGTVDEDGSTVVRFVLALND